MGMELILHSKEKKNKSEKIRICVVYLKGHSEWHP